MKKLVLFLILFFGITLDAMSQWSQILNDTAVFNSGIGNDVIRYKGYLWFSQGNNIRKFDGTNWSSGKGVTYPFGSFYPSVFCIWRDTLYAGGRLIETLTGKTFGVIKWSGSNWVGVLQIDAGYKVVSMASFQNNLYVGGDFYSIGSIISPLERVSLVKYDGVNCTKICKLTTSCGPLRVHAVDSIAGKLYVGGYFDYLNDTIISHKTFTYNGLVFDTLIGYGTCTDVVNDFVYYKDSVIALGPKFTPLDGNLFKLIGNSWQHLAGSDIGLPNITAAVVNDTLFVAGEYPWCSMIVGGVATNYYTGITPLGSEKMNKLYFDKTTGKLYITGTFQKAFGAVANGIAVFNQQFSIILPIELLNFSCNDVGNSVLLEWQTASEINNDYFEIERSSNGIDWEALMQIKGAGTTNTIQSYNFLDEVIVEGIHYYRLKQVDYDGKFSYSHICGTEIQPNNKLIVYPNPFVEEINFSRITSGILYDLWGREIEYLKNTNYINTNALSSGVYMYIDISGEKFKIIK